MRKSDAEMARETARKTLAALLRIDMVRVAISPLGASNSVNKTDLANIIYHRTVKRNDARAPK